MYEDTPQELVHDLFSQAVFGTHALGRPGDRHRGGDLDRQQASGLGLSPLDVQRREHRRLCSRQHHARAAARPPRERRAQERGTRTWDAAGPAAARPAARAGAPLPAQGHRAVPPLPRGAGHLALRPPPVRRVDSRFHPRRLCVIPSLPGDPRETRDGVLGLQLRVAVHGHGPRRRLRRHARGESRLLCRDLHGADRRHRARQPAPGRARARAGEPEGKDHALDGVDVEPDEPARQVGHLRHRADDVRPHLRRDRRRRQRGRRGARDRPAAAGAAFCLGRRPGRGATSGSRSSARTPRSSRAPPHEPRVLRREGKVGVALVPVLERAGHVVRSIKRGDEPNCADSTPPSTSRRPAPRPGTCAPRSSRASRASSAPRAGTPRTSTVLRASEASGSSWLRTSRSARS